MKKIISTILAILTLCTMVMAKPFTTATVSDYKESQTLIEQENNTGALQYAEKIVYQAPDYTATNASSGFYQKQYKDKIFNEQGTYTITATWDFSNMTDVKRGMLWIFEYDALEQKYYQISALSTSKTSGTYSYVYEYLPTFDRADFYIAVGGEGAGTIKVTDIKVSFLPGKPLLSNVKPDSESFGECIYYEDFEYFKTGTVSNPSVFTGYDGSDFDFTVSGQQISKYEIVDVGGNSKLAITVNGQYPQIKFAPNIKNMPGVYRVVAEFTNKSSAARNGQIWVYADNIYNDNKVTSTTAGENGAVSLASGATATHSEKWEIRSGENLSNTAFAVGSGNTTSGDVLYIDNIAIYRMDRPTGEIGAAYGKDFTKDYGEVLFYENFENSTSATSSVYSYIDAYNRNNVVSYQSTDGMPTLSLDDGNLVLTKTGVSTQTYPMFTVSFTNTYFNKPGIYTVFYKYKFTSGNSPFANLQMASTNANYKDDFDELTCEDGYKFYKGYYIVENGKTFNNIKVGAVITADTVMKVDEIILCYKPWEESESGAAASYEEVSLRLKNPTGLRFKSFITNQQRELADEYGYIVSLEALLNAKGITKADNFASFTHNSDVTYVQGKAYIKGTATDLVFESFTDGIDFTGVIIGVDYSKYSAIPIVARPYVKYGRYYYYGDAVVRSIGFTAQSIKKDSAVYEGLGTNGKQLVDEITGYVGDTVLEY